MPRFSQARSWADREQVWAQLTRDQCEELGLAEGQIVYLRAAQERVFA